MIKWFLILTLSTFITISFSNEIDHNPYLVTIDEIQTSYIYGFEELAKLDYNKNFSKDSLFVIFSKQYYDFVLNHVFAKSRDKLPLGIVICINSKNEYMLKSIDKNRYLSYTKGLGPLKRVNFIFKNEDTLNSIYTIFHQNFDYRIIDQIIDEPYVPFNVDSILKINKYMPKSGKTK